MVQRLAALERYGLAEATLRGDEFLILEVAADDAELADRASGHWLAEQERQRLSVVEAALKALKADVAQRIDQYAAVHDGWFIRYDPDWETFDYHRAYAEFFAAGIAEAHELPANALLGGRTFAEWCSTSTTALGRLLHHVACATRLRSTHPHLQLRNLLTVFARKSDITAVWRETGESPEWAARIVEGLSLDVEGAAIAEWSSDIPLPYYIDFGEYQVLGSNLVL